MQTPYWRPLSADRNELVALLSVPEGYELRSTTFTENATVLDDFGNVLSRCAADGVLRVALTKKKEESNE